ncbi:MAG: cytochrome-c oxidase, cbb3-type subunit I, partial [Microvirga sp.]
MVTTTETKYMTEGEGGLFVVLAVGTLSCVFAAANAVDTAFAFHAYLSAAASLGALALVLNRYIGRGAAPVPREIDGKPNYNFGPVKFAAVASMAWGIAGFLVGVIIAFQLWAPELNLGLPYTTFGRLRPLHTSAVIFAFGGNVLIATSLYVVQRTCRVRLAGDLAPWFVVLGYNFFIVIAGTGYLLGVTQSKEYAEPEWYADLWLTIVWVVYLLVFLATIWKRKEPHIFVANWFYLAFIVTIAMLHIVNNLAMPVSFFGSKSYPIFAGVQDALVQWWYGHNAVAFFLTTPFLGVMYYFIPKAANRPVFSYRLSIVHFWSLIFLYIWAGPHHLHYTALPDWAQSLGTVFSIMLIAPSWGGMVNGLLTLRGAWDRVRESPVLKFMVVGVTAYGMATFEGPMMSLKNVNAMVHYTDYIIAHVHVGALAWNGGLTFAMLYYVFPRIYGTKLYSTALANVHFWLATLGILFYAIPMYVGGITQSLMWQEFTPDGSLRYANFLETVVRLA